MPDQRASRFVDDPAIHSKNAVDSGRDRRDARALGAVVGMVGLATLASTLLPTWRGRLPIVEDLLTPGATRFASGAAALTGTALVLVGRGVASRRRTAWILSVTLLGLATTAHLAKGLDFEAALTTLSVAIVLIRKRKIFNVAPPAAQFLRLARLIAAAVAVDVAYGLVGLVLRAHDVRPALNFRNAIGEVLARLVGGSGPLVVSGRFGKWFPASLTALGALTIVVALLAILGPVALPGAKMSDELAELKALIDRVDGDTLDPFVARTDKRRLFTPDRKAAIGYRNVSGVGLASGDPVGDPELFQQLVSEFVALCDRFGWRPAIVGARLERRHIYEHIGLKALYIGDEAVIDVNSFALIGGRMRKVRLAYNATVNAGVTTEFYREGDLDQNYVNGFTKFRRLSEETNGSSVSP
jgi:lysyl-tRNA synthetase, class II